MVKALACDSTGQVTTVSKLFTKLYNLNLVPVAGQSCPATGKVTVGLASH